MKGERYLLFLIASLAISCSSTKLAPTYDKGLLTLIDRNFQEAADQYLYLSTQIPADRLPRSFGKDGLVTSDDEV